MRLKPNSFVGFTQTLEKKIIPLFRKQKAPRAKSCCVMRFLIYTRRVSLC
jgi:hypothetical protein